MEPDDPISSLGDFSRRTDFPQWTDFSQLADISRRADSLPPHRLLGADRHAFAHMIARANGGFWMSGCAVEWITLGDAWLSKAQTAHYRALKACEYEYDNYEVLAGSEWQKIFGTMISLTV